MTVRSVLLLNSDIAVNRGDRAITEGILTLVRQRFPGAQTTVVSQQHVRDGAWYGSDVLDMDIMSLDPRDLVRVVRAARRADLVFWGGGEMLKDYTNRAALWYWAVKIGAVSLANERLYGVYQGIGPTLSERSRRLIVQIVERARVFIVRDQESFDKAVAWGADPERLVVSSDPAVLPEAIEPDDDLRGRLADEHGLDAGFLDDFVCLAPRDWFHYRTGGFLPYKFARRLPWRRRAEGTADPRNRRYHESLAGLLDELLARSSGGVLLVPMHMAESDGDLCEWLRERSTSPDRVRVLGVDSLGPSELRTVFALARAMVGFRLHATILATSARVPSINIFYVDKGRVYFDQLGQTRWALPIEAALEDDFVSRVGDLFEDLLNDADQVRAELAEATERLRSSISEAFDAIVAFT